MSVAIIRFPGTNCEYDMNYAYRDFECDIIWHKDKKLPYGTKLVILPGGFSYGDYLRSGAIAKISPIMDDIKKFAQDGGFVLGICNGFQILTESGMLEGVLKRNTNLKFISKSALLRVENNQNKFLESYSVGDKIKLPIAHADGNYFVDNASLERMKDNGQILLRYVQNPNGSLDDIAGICNENKNVFGLMPHPERAIESILGGCDGVEMLRALAV